MKEETIEQKLEYNKRLIDAIEKLKEHCENERDLSLDTVLLEIEGRASDYWHAKSAIEEYWDDVKHVEVCERELKRLKEKGNNLIRERAEE